MTTARRPFRESGGEGGRMPAPPARFKPYPEYKDSGVEWLGKIPAHWDVKRLRSVAAVNPSRSETRALPATLEVRAR